MTEEELYLFDTLGFLRVENVLDEETVAQAQRGAQKIVDDCGHLLEQPPGSGYGDKYKNAIVHDKVLERIAYSPVMLDYACHLTNNMPRLLDGTMMVQNSDHGFHNFHLRKDILSEMHEDAPRFYTDVVHRRIYCDWATFFVYLTDVRPGDGGLLVVPGAHRASFIYPPELFYAKDAYPVDPEERQKLGFINVTANAGDMIIMPLRLNHAALPWLPVDRDRILMFYTYRPQFYCSEPTDQWLAAAAAAGIQLDVETIELASMKEKGELKDIVKSHLGIDA